MTGKPLTIQLLETRLLADRPHLKHGFTTRQGGVSVGAAASLDLGDGPHTDRGAVEENWRRATIALGSTPDRVALLRQVHGARVVRVEEPRGPHATVAEADGAVTTEPGIVLAVRTADCVPVLLACEGAVAVAHAGWRGTALGVVPETVALLRQLGRGPIVAAIGPHISADVYEVGEEVVEGLSAIPRAVYVRPGRRGRPHVDLGAAVRWQLEQAAVDQVEQLGGCTLADPRFYSYRGEGPLTGRLAGLIMRSR